MKALVYELSSSGRELVVKRNMKGSYCEARSVSGGTLNIFQSIALGPSVHMNPLGSSAVRRKIDCDTLTS